MYNSHRKGRLILRVLLFTILVFGSLLLFSDTTKANTRITGVALKAPTNVYQNTSTSSKVLKDYPQGAILIYEPFNATWYRATVYANGSWRTGYINKNDVENSVTNQTVLKGVAQNNPTNVYRNASTNSSKLKSYSEGSILIYKSFSSNWYEATVFIKGKPTTGYIHKSHVENATQNQQVLSGLGLKNPTAVYSSASTNSSKLKSYSIGSKLYYSTFTSNWYEATVYVNGKRRTGYIHHSHVEPPSNTSESFKGVALRSSTPVYREASTNGGAWKSYPVGSILYYRSFSKNWYEATVYVNGKRRIGYIHHSHVENAVKDQKTLKGIGVKNPTTVYAAASTGSKALKSYASGSILYYQTFSSNWYEATIYLNGKRRTGYIHTSHVEELLPGKQQNLDGRALKRPTHVYSRASQSSNVLKSYNQGTMLKFRTFSKNWYEATVYISGKPRTGYIYVGDITTKDITNYTKYNYSFKYMVDRQMAYGGNKSDGAGKVSATREEVEYYVNPANFKQGTQSYYQFLDLTQPAGLNANEINQNILRGKGSLHGTGQAFIDAGRKYNINEAYLIAHTLHETGNGTSTLAAGVKVDSKGNVVSDPNKATHTVYNMYGYGAKDSCPLTCGAKYAFDEGWFTPSAAILGGAGKVAQNYINKGQDTLYKMKWNPDNPATHQYATHVQWAVIQTKRIADIYKSLNNYTLVYDVPSFINQPSPTPEPDTTPPPNTGVQETFPSNIFGIVSVDSGNLMLRKTPDGDIIDKMPKGAKIEVLGSNGEWLNVKYGGKTGWAHGDFIKLLNLLEVTATGLYVRDTPVNGAQLGQLSNQLVAGVLDSNNKVIRQNEWYKIYYNNKEAWISGGKNGTEFVKVR
ncbi:SH3 domain-containing protein [Virgibacillus sp. MG-45]|uniref:SH3 domain-containing protein n=1 Tax=Virgibacillus sp. MG-45 TaxID=3102791 RepID=UPI002ED8BF03